jgi:hypothetical protein
MNNNDIYNTNLPGPLDYEQLKEYGLAYIRSIANKQWTDFNLHDPGVTILEALCFALTDLAFRTRFSMADLLTPKGENHPRLSGTLFPAHDILSHEPISINDYRKFILESVPGVRNVWIEKNDYEVSNNNVIGLTGNEAWSVKGLYKISLELEDDYSIENSEWIRGIVGRDNEGRYAELFDENYSTFYEHYVRNFMLKHRNLCEDVHEVKALTSVPIGLFIEIETEQDADYKQILTEMFGVINNYVSPSLDFHTLPEMLKKGKSPEEIYQGLVPRYGFIDLDELEHFDKKKSLYTSDLLNLLMKIKGVKSIKRLLFRVDEENRDKVSFNSYKTSITLNSDDYVFSLRPFSLAEKNEAEDELHNIYFNCGNYSIRPKLTAVMPYLDNRYTKYQKVDKEYPLPQGKHRNTATYYSFQHLFPKTYRMGTESIPDNASNLRKAERLQLKAYLTFFDQLLADYVAQLSAMERYFSIDGNDIEPTYFFHELQDSEIVDVKNVLNDKVEQGLSTADLDRRSRIMDHLLARFNDSFADYAVLSYLSNKEGLSANDLSVTKAKSIKYKKELLNNYAQLSGARSQAIDYTENLQISPLERRIMARLGITKPRFKLSPTVAHSYPKNNKFKEKVRQYVFNDNRDEPYEQTFGIHILEHLLLFPYQFLNIDNFLKLSMDDDSNKNVADPYSFHVTVLVPGWLRICQNMQFRAFVESTVRSELPAHVVAKVCWVDPLVMFKFEESYKAFVNTKLKKRPFSSLEANESEWKEGLDEMVKVFNEFRNLYFHSIDYELNTEGDSVQAKTFYKGWHDGTSVEELPRIGYVKLDPWYSDDSSALGYWKFKEKEEQTK